MRYVIQFEFPGHPEPLFAGDNKGAMGFAPELAGAMFFDDPNVAERYLENGYGASRLHGVVVPIDESQ